MTLWHEKGWDDVEDWDPDVGYWERAGCGGDPKAIGTAMRARLEEKGVELDSIEYPNYEEIVRDIKRRKAAE